MREKIFKAKDLRLCDFQYEVRHTDINNFSEGEKVFLKSNPEHPMTVHSVDGNITCIWYSTNEELQICSFPPECLLQYKYAGLLTWKKKFSICLN